MYVFVNDRSPSTIALLATCIASFACASRAPSPAATGAAGGLASPSAAAASEWTYSKTITLDTTPSGANVPEDVRRYPLAVLLDKSRFDFSQARPDGADLRFFDAAGAALPHAIE